FAPDGVVLFYPAGHGKSEGAADISEYPGQRAAATIEAIDAIKILGTPSGEFEGNFWRDIDGRAGPIRKGAAHFLQLWPNPRRSNHMVRTQEPSFDAAKGR